MITSDTRINKIVSPINNRIEELRIELYNNEDKENFRGHAKRGWSSLAFSLSSLVLIVYKNFKQIQFKIKHLIDV
jgi:hypothetical protein